MVEEGPKEECEEISEEVHDEKYVLAVLISVGVGGVFESLDEGGGRGGVFEEAGELKCGMGRAHFSMLVGGERKRRNCRGIEKVIGRSHPVTDMHRLGPGKKVIK